MNKLRLSLDALRVESFEMEQGMEEEGTVYAHVVSNARCNSAVSCLPDTCYWETCMDCAATIGACTSPDTCGEVSCTTDWTYIQPTCPFSCNPTCTC